MKKPYEKPVIFFENFSLSTNIAAGCGTMVNFSEVSCGYETSRGRYVFIDGNTGCASIIQIDPNYHDQVYNGICYHVPTESSKFFNS